MTVNSDSRRPTYFQVEVMVPFGPGSPRSEDDAQDLIAKLRKFTKLFGLDEPYVEQFEEEPVR
jgi:hypothetical protein